MKTKLLPLAVLCLMIVSISCTKGLKDDVDALQKPMPSGLVLLDDSLHKVVKGEEFEIHFRVNPSGVGLANENVELDFIESDTYLQYTPQQGEQIPETKASYVTPSEYYECVALEADKNEAGEVLDGQWVLTVKTKGEANFMNKSSFFLVLNYTDATGQKRLISSSKKVNAQIFPTIDEGMAIGYSKGQTFRGAMSGTVLPYQILLIPRFYKNQDGNVWIYDKALMNQADVVLSEADKDLFTVEQHLTEDYISLVPTEHEKWTAFEQSDDISVSASATVNLVDIAGMVKKEPLNISYYKSELNVSLNVSATELNRLSTKEYLNVDIKEWFDKLGIAVDYAMENRPYAWLPSGSHIFGDPVNCYLVVDRNKLQNILRIRRNNVVKPGEHVTETKGLQGNTSYKPESMIPVNLKLYEVKIQIQINVVE